MSELFSSLFLICALSLIVIQKCNGIMNVPLQDSIIVSALTPFDEDGNLNYSMIPELAQYYKDNGIKVILVAGFYGAGPSIPLPERKRLVVAWEEQTNCLGFDLIVEVGAMPFVDILEMARYCSTLNVTAITAFGEIVYQASTVSEAVEDLQQICDAAGNKLPLLYHELPANTDFYRKIKTDEIFLGAYDGSVSCFVGAITTINTFLNIKAAVDSIAGYQLWGQGMEAIAASFKVGMNATVIVDMFPDIARKIQVAVNVDCDLELAADLQQVSNRRMYGTTNENGGTVDPTSRTYFEQVKAGFQLMNGIDLGYRYPLQKPNSTVINKIRSNLRRLGVRLSNKKN